MPRPTTKTPAPATRPKPIPTPDVVASDPSREVPGGYPVIIRDALGEFEIHFISERERERSLNQIQTAVTGGSGRRNTTRIVECIEGKFWFCSVQSLRIP